MAFEKAKVLKAAEKFLSQGKIDAAIKEYREIVEHDEEDFTTLNMLGDLCVRAGKKDEAISCFMRIAEHYRDQEFTLKAIAMYKKVDRLRQGDPVTAKNLAELYVNQGLIVDARAQYLILADYYNRSDETKRALEVLRKIADLDPQNTEIRVKLASGYLKEGLHAEASVAYKEAGARLFEIGEFEKALQSYAKALELRPYDREALRGIGSAHVALGTADEAAERLEKVVADRPEDPDLVSMLAAAYIQAEDPRGAERATEMLISQDASNYTRFSEVARLYLKANEVDEAARILTNITEQMLAGREENDLLELVNEVLARDPDHVEALRLLVRIHWWQRDMEKLRTTLERLVEAAEAAGLADQERYALTQLVRLAPDEERYTARLNELGGLQDEATDENSFAAEPGATDVPSFESFAMAAVDGTQMVAIDAGMQPSESVKELAEFEWNSVAEPAVSDPDASFADLNEVLQENEISFASEAATFEYGDSDLDQLRASEVTDQSEDSLKRRDSLRRQELESVDFYISQGYFDIAVDTLDLLERQFGSNEETEARRRQLEAVPHRPPEPVATIEFGDVPETAIEPTVGSDFDFALTDNETIAESKIESSGWVASPVGSGIDSGLAEVFEEFKVAAEGESTRNEDYETHYNMGTAYKEMELLDEAIHEFQQAATMTRPGDGTTRYLQCCNMLGHCFVQKGMPRAAVMWFKKGLDSPGHDDEEYVALRYELGAAYEQMGDLRRALDMFTEVYGMNISYRDVGEKLIELQQRMPQRK